MAQAALDADVHPRQLSFKHTVQLWAEWTADGASLRPLFGVARFAQLRCLGSNVLSQVCQLFIGQFAEGGHTGGRESPVVHDRGKCFSRQGYGGSP
jgi:hypothetical protein